MKSFSLLISIILNLIVVSCTKDYSVNLPPFEDPLPDTFSKNDYSSFQWEKLDLVVDSDYAKLLLSNKDHLFVINKDIFRSRDHGLTWDKVALSSNQFYLVSYNKKGLTWDKVALSSYGPNVIFASSIDQSDTLLISTDHNLLISGDYGNSWIVRDKPDMGNALLKTSSGAIILGMFFKAFNEDTFRSTNSGNEEHAYIKDIVINSSNRPFIISRQGLYRLKE